jgi:hypothetical protein
VTRRQQSFARLRKRPFALRFVLLTPLFLDVDRVRDDFLANDGDFNNLGRRVYDDRLWRGRDSLFLCWAKRQHRRNQQGKDDGGSDGDGDGQTRCEEALP